MSYPAELTHAVDSRLIVLKKVHKQVIKAGSNLTKVHGSGKVSDCV